MIILSQMGFAILYGFFCGSFLSLTPAVAAHLYGADRLAGLSGLLLLFNVPGEYSRILLLHIKLPHEFFCALSHAKFVQETGQEHH